MPNKKNYQWAVVGAGPAGIAAVGKLLDHAIPPTDVLWLDTNFRVGDLGGLWANVSSNTVVSRFLDFLHAADSFSYEQAPIDFELNHLPTAETCVLSQIVKPLQWITNQLRNKVTNEKTRVHTMELKKRTWTLCADSQTYQAKNVILATGAVPSSLSYAGVDVMPFEIAIDEARLKQCVVHDHTYGVFGSSHSAIIIIRSLVELGVRKIINFYRSPCRYAIEMGDWILFDNTGLKGQTAAWARQNIDGVLPANLVRYTINEYNITRYLPECHQIVYAVGFKKRNNIMIDHYEHTSYNPHVGIIGPGLFGLGIGYPEQKADPFGTIEWQVGLWKFMVYLNRVMPIWFKYPA